MQLSAVVIVCVAGYYVLLILGCLALVVESLSCLRLYQSLLLVIVTVTVTVVVVVVVTLLFSSVTK